MILFWFGLFFVKRVEMISGKATWVKEGDHRWHVKMWHWNCWSRLKNLKGRGSSIKKKRAECGKTDLQNGFRFLLCLHGLRSITRSPGQRGEPWPGSPLPRGQLPPFKSSPGSSAPCMNLSCPTGASLLQRWSHFIAQICCCTVTLREHQLEYVLTELSQVP